MNLETKITIYKFTPQLFTLTRFIYKRGYGKDLVHIYKPFPLDS